MRAPQGISKLLNRDFYLLWQGQAVSRLGDQMYTIAMILWVKYITDSATLVSIMVMLSTLPGVILGPFGGAVADRYSRKNIMILSDYALGLFRLILAFYMFISPDAIHLAMVGLFINAVLAGVVNAFFSPAISASIPEMVPKERLSSANSLVQFSIQLAVFIGQGLGGTLFRLVGAPVMFFINGWTYWFAAVSTVLITVRQRIPKNSGHWKTQLQDFKLDLVTGLRYVWDRKGLKQLVLLSTGNVFFSAPILVLMPFYVEDTLKAPVDWYGFLLATYGIGEVLGYLLIGTAKLTGKARSNIMILCMILQSAGFAMLGIIAQRFIALGLVLVGGIVGGIVSISVTTVMQTTTPGEIRGRIFGLLGTIAGSVAPIAIGLAGVLADLLNQNISLIYVICGLAMVTMTLLISLSGAFRHFLAADEIQQADTSSSAKAGCLNQIHEYDE